MQSDEEITRNWVGSGRIDQADFAQLKAGYLASLDNPPDCTTCPAFEHEVQHHFQFKYRISKPSPTVNTRHLKFIILGGILMLPGASYSIVNEGVESVNAKVLTNKMAEEILTLYPTYDTLLVPNPDYDEEAEAERIEFERAEAEQREQKQAEADQAAQDEADRLADEQALTDNLLKQSLPASGQPRTDETAGTSTTGTQKVSEGNAVRTDETAGTSSTGTQAIKADEQPGALATDSAGQVSGQATAQTTDTTTTTPPVADQMQLNLGDNSGTVTTPPVTPEGAEAEKKS